MATVASLWGAASAPSLGDAAPAAGMPSLGGAASAAEVASPAGITVPPVPGAAAGHATP